MSLVEVRPGVVFRTDAAASFCRVEKQAGRRCSVNRTTEDTDTQMTAYRKYLAYLNGGPWAPLALHPDRSRHVYRPGDPLSATAWDTDERGHWLDDHGWIADVAGELWHREYRYHRDNHRHETPAPTITREDPDIMKLIQATARGIAVIGPGYFKGLTPEELGIAIELHGWPRDYGDNARAFDLARSIAINGTTANDTEIAAIPADTAAATIRKLHELTGS